MQLMITLLHVSQMMMCAVIMSCSKPSPYFFLPVILVQVDLNFSRPKNALQEVLRLFFLMFFWQSLIWPCLQLVVKPLYLLWWSLLLIVDFDRDTSASWRVFFSWLDVVKGFFFTMERILWWTSRPFYVAELTSAFFFFSECTELLIWPLRMFLLSLSDGFVLFLKPNNCLFHLYGEILWPHDVGLQQLLNANGTLRINSRPFTCLIDVELTKKNSPRLSMKQLLSQLSNYLWSLEKGGEVHINVSQLQ